LAQFILIFIVWLVTMCALGYVIYKNYKSKKSVSKKFPTEFNKMGLSVGLSRNDIKEIRNLLAEAGITKPYMIFLDSSILEKMVTENINKIETLNIPELEKEKRLLHIFDIKRKINNHYLDMHRGIRSTLEIEPNQLLSMKVAGVGNFYSIVIINDKRNLICSIPDIKDPTSVQWKDKQVEIYFWRYNDAGYIFKTKIENVVFSSKLQALMIAHQETLKRIQRREYPRRKCRFDVKFFKFSVSTNDDGKPVVLLSRTHIGIMIDISPDGASVISDDALAKNSAVKLEFNIDERKIVVYGTILNVIKKRNMFVMHIKFQRISDASKTQIYRYVYKYI